jgi:hypothetical protein
MKRRFVAAAAALLCLGVLAPAVSAGDDWCSTDPAVVIHTPGGNTVVVHLTDSALGSEHAAALRDAEITQTVQTVSNQPATDVEIQVVVPDDAFATGFRTQSVASTQPDGAGTVLASDEGKSGQTMKLRFRLDVP